MRVKILKVQTVATDAINSKTWPVGWVGEIDDAILAKWAKGDFEPSPVDADDETPRAADAKSIPAAAFTPEQVAVLMAAADLASQQAAAAAEGEDPEAAEAAEQAAEDARAAAQAAADAYEANEAEKAKVAKAAKAKKRGGV